TDSVFTMPTYEYQCLKCGHRFDHFQSITAEPLKYCVASECIFEDEEKRGEGEVKRIVSGGAGLVFKGEGFYLTDYARKRNGGESGSSAASGNGDSGSSASKE